MAAGGQDGLADQRAGFLIDRRFRVLTDRPQPKLGGHDCLAARDEHEVAGKIVAVRGVPMLRAELPAFLDLRHPAMLSHLAHGAGAGGYWMISEAPAGLPLSTAAMTVSGNALLTQVLRPVSMALDYLHTHGQTHRAIRPDNVFLGADGRSAILGPACAAPPAYRQPALYESPYGALCAPAARGRGTIQDDVYALGVLLLDLWTRALPHAGLAPLEIARLKLDQGSYATLAGNLRLPRSLDEMLRAMLSDDPQSRPLPSDLAHLDSSHARRSGRRASLRAARPLALGERFAWNRPTLALFCAEQPEQAVLALRTGALEQWLRRTADDPALVVEAEALRRDDLQLEARTARVGASDEQIEQNLRLARLISVLDPLAPLFWEGVWLAPDALGTLLAEAARQPPSLDPARASRLVRGLLASGGLEAWILLRSARSGVEVQRPPQKLTRLADTGNIELTLFRVIYTLNPFLPCQTKLLGASPVIGLREMAAGLEQLAATGGPITLDAPARAFIEARLEDQPPAGEAAGSGALPQSLRDLVLLSRCQVAARLGPLPGLATALLASLEPVLAEWPGVSRREVRLAALRRLAGAGELRPMLELLTDLPGRLEDEAAQTEARDEAAILAASLQAQPEVKRLMLAGNISAARDTACAVGALAVMASLLLDLL